MPYVNFTTLTGPVEFHYNISTPTEASSSTIVEDLPCIVFIHSGYIAQEVFEPQFADPQLRLRFNLIGLDMRSWGTTKGAVVKDIYTPAVAADDIYKFMTQIKLPPVHVFALSIGSSVALELAIAHPELVLSLTLCSPLPTEEPEDIAAGRHEVFYYWSNSFKHDGDHTPEHQLERDDAMLADLLRGSQELMFNDQTSRLTHAMTMTAVDHAMNNWAGTQEKLTVCFTVSVDWFLERKPFSLAALGKIRCPVTLIHCADDIAYPLRHAQELKAQLHQAGVKHVTLYQVSGPHFGSTVNPIAVNPILRDTVILGTSIARGYSRRNAFVFANSEQGQGQDMMITPFSEWLARHGYDPHGDSDSDSDSDIDVI